MNLTISPHEKYILAVLNNKKIFFWLEYFLINDSAHQDDQLQDWTLIIFTSLRWFFISISSFSYLKYSCSDNQTSSYLTHLVPIKQVECIFGTKCLIWLFSYWAVTNNICQVFNFRPFVSLVLIFILVLFLY